MDVRSFRPGVLGDDASVKGLKLVASDGSVGRVSWASYAPGESYLVVTTGRLRRRHHVLPAGAVTQVSDGEVRVSFSRAEIGALPPLADPQAFVGADTVAQMLDAFERAASTPQSGGF